MNAITQSGRIIAESINANLARDLVQSEDRDLSANAVRHMARQVIFKIISEQLPALPRHQRRQMAACYERERWEASKRKHAQETQQGE